MKSKKTLAAAIWTNLVHKPDQSDSQGQGPGQVGEEGQPLDEEGVDDETEEEGVRTAACSVSSLLPLWHPCILTLLQLLRPNPPSMSLLSVSHTQARSTQHDPAVCLTHTGQIHPACSCCPSLTHRPNPPSMILLSVSHTQAKSTQHDPAVCLSHTGQIHPAWFHCLSLTHTLLSLFVINVPLSLSLFLSFCLSLSFSRSFLCKEHIQEG